VIATQNSDELEAPFHCRKRSLTVVCENADRYQKKNRRIVNSGTLSGAELVFD
jgi:hypothetical protein